MGQHVARPKWDFTDHKDNYDKTTIGGLQYHNEDYRLERDQRTTLDEMGDNILNIRGIHSNLKVQKQKEKRMEKSNCGSRCIKLNKLKGKGRRKEEFL